MVLRMLCLFYALRGKKEVLKLKYVFWQIRPGYKHYDASESIYPISIRIYLENPLHPQLLRQGRGFSLVFTIAFA